MKSVSICYLWSGKRHVIDYKISDPLWRDHFQLLVLAGKKPSLIYHAESVHTEARS